MEFTLGEQLKKLNLSSWPTLNIAFVKSWVTKYDIENYAISLLSVGSYYNDVVALLADARSYSDDDVKAMMIAQYDPNKVDEELEVKKLKLSALMYLNDNNVPEEEKCKILQDLYVDFDYPDDMRECSVYSGVAISPIKAMHTLIEGLKKELNIDQSNNAIS